MAAGLGGTAIVLVAHLIRLDVNVVAADRFLYFPVAALAIGLAPVAEQAWRRRRKVVLLVSAVILGSFTVATALRTRTWADELALWRQEVEHSPPSVALPRVELAVALMHRGRYDEALALLGQVPADQRPAIAINLATCLDKVGKRTQAMALLSDLIRAEPKRSRARLNLMLMYARDRRFDAARAVGADLITELGDRLDIKALVEQVDRSASDWAELPPETIDESSALRARRAAWFERLGALPEAQARWTSVALDSRAPADLRLQGATYLALDGSEQGAHAVLGALATEGGIASKLTVLRAAFEARFDEK
jgi:tetratricopeptide (TPR) repeat protein